MRPCASSHFLLQFRLALLRYSVSLCFTGLMAGDSEVRDSLVVWLNVRVPGFGTLRWHFEDPARVEGFQH